jgi:hypothetical protein
MIERRWLVGAFAYSEGEPEEGVFQRLERQREVHRNLALGYEAAAGPDPRTSEDEQATAGPDRLPPEERHKRLAIAATNFRRAAAHSLLLSEYGQQRDSYGFGYENDETDELSARALFRKAAEAYHRLRMPYTLLMESFASRRASTGWRTLTHWLDEESSDGDTRYQQQLIYLLLAVAATLPSSGIGIRPYDEVYRQLESFRARPLGTLGFPLAYYLDLYAAFRGYHRAPTLEEAIFPFIAGYNAAVRQATSNDYHWRRLAMPFHPVEPDVFGVLLLAGRVMEEKEGRTVLSLLERLPLAAVSRTLLEGVLSDYDEDQAAGRGMAAFAD